MSFQIKDFASITASMLNWLKANTAKVTDMTEGGVARTMLEASAIEIEEAYLQFYVGLKEAIPVSVFTTFGFTALEAEAASGVIRFSIASPATSSILIPAGTLTRVPNTSLNYATLADGYILTGQTYVEILAAAQSPGIAGNTDSSTITELVSTLPVSATITNPAPLVNGREAETSDQQRVRFQGYIATLARGTKAAIEYGAQTAKLTNTAGVVTEYVAYANVVEPWVTDNTQPISLVRCYVHNGASATSSSLVTEAQRVIDGYYLSDGVTVAPSTGWRAAGAKCIVAAASDLAVDVTGDVYVLAGYDEAAVVAEAESAISAYIQTRGVGVDVQLAELVAIVKRDVPGVFNVVLSDPTADVVVDGDEKAIPGAITLTAA